MENFDKFPYFSDEEVKLIAYCPFCESDLNPVKAKVVDDKDDSQLIHIQCNNCKGFILALLTKTVSGLSSIGLITDLTFEDVFQFKDKARLQADEIETSQLSKSEMKNICKIAAKGEEEFKKEFGEAVLLYKKLEKEDRLPKLKLFPSQVKEDTKLTQKDSGF